MSDTGPHRVHNDDGFLLDESSRRYAVIDAMGASGGGYFAARAVERCLMERQDPASSLLAAHQVLRDLRPEMGPVRADVTLVNLSVATLHLAHSGATAAHLLRGDSVTRLTRSYAWLDIQVQAGHVTPSEVHLDRICRNVRVHDLGFDEDLQIDTAVVSIAAGDTIVLTSDGIWRYVTDEDFISTSKAPTPELACRSLLERARTAGSDDVMTVLVTTVPR